MVLGYFVPFLTAPEKRRSLGSRSACSPAVFGLGDAGDGPFSGEATMAAVVVSGLSLAALSFTVGGAAALAAAALHPAD